MRKYNEMYVIGIDHGYGNMKTENCCFKTGLLAYDAEPLFTGDMLVYDGKYYLIGEGHKEFLPDKIRDEDYYILTLVAIAKELQREKLTEARVIIAAGLPLTWTSGQKKDFAAYLSKNKEVCFTYQKVDYHITIEGVRIYPQGYAAIADFATTMNGVNMVADIGNGTMNVLYMINGRPQAGKMYTEKFGTYQCTLAVREMFMQKTQREINDAIIEEVLITGAANIAPADQKIIRAIATEYVKDIFRRLREHGYDEGTMTLYISLPFQTKKRSLLLWKKSATTLRKWRKTKENGATQTDCTVSYIGLSFRTPPKGRHFFNSDRADSRNAAGPPVRRRLWTGLYPKPAGNAPVCSGGRCLRISCPPPR